MAGTPAASDTLRLAFLHSELSRDGPGLLLRDILTGDNLQVTALRRVIRAVDPDVLVLAGVDWDLQGHTLDALADAIGPYPHLFSARPNRGLQSGVDLDGDGDTGGIGDAFGHAEFAGKEGMAILSRLPFDLGGFRDFTEMQWGDLPSAMADDREGASMRFSTTVHWSLPVSLPDGGTLALLTWHATPPVFDGPGDRNGRRNHDETAFWLHYLDGVFGTVPDRFVLMGAANLDPVDGDGRPDALLNLLSHEHVRDLKPASEGAVKADIRDAGVNLTHKGDASLDTVDWPDTPGRPGNLRVDYVLPSANLDIMDSGVFWPDADTSLGRDVTTASRHRLIWIDIRLSLE